MPPKRRGAQPKPTTKPDPPKSAPAPPPPPPPPPPETDATKVRKEWSKFVDTWYEPQKKKLVEKLQKDLLVKYKSLGSAKETQKLREMELFEKLDSIAGQLAQPARAEWERRLELAQLREDQWNDMSGEEQHVVMSVFVGFFTNDVEDIDDDDLSSVDPSSIDEEESLADEPLYKSVPSYPPGSSRQPIPPTPTRQTFEFVHPTSFFADPMTPPNPTKNLPALSMDYLTTLGPSTAGRSAEPVSASASAGGMPGFQGWASEAGIVAQQSQPLPAKLPPAATATQTLSARPRATDNMSRQASAASTSTSSPQHSPPIPTTKFSPSINAENLPLGKRYIGPIVLEEDPDPLDEELLKSKMADEYQQYKVGLRIQMIYQFHAEAAEVEIKLFETLLADEGTKESRARAVQEHETSMMRLREQKEEERKRLCAEEREKRREEMRHHLAQRRSAQSRETESAPKVNPPKSSTSAQQRSTKVTHQKENVPLSQPVAVPPSKLEPPDVIKKSNSMLSQDEASANEALFANAMAMMTQGKTGAAMLTPAQASLNEALFSNAAAVLGPQGQPGGSAKNTVQPPSIMKKSSSSRSQEHNIPRITVSFAEPSTTAPPEPAQVPPTAVKSRKGKKGQPAVQPTPAKPVAITEEPKTEMDAELPPPTPSLWDTATVIAQNVWGTAPPSRARLIPSVEEERVPDPASMTAPAPSPSKGNDNAKKAISAARKGKKVTITEEPDIDADPIVSPPSVKAKAAKGAWGSVSSKSKATPTVAEESEVEPFAPPPPVTPMPARGKKVAEVVIKAGQKPQLKVAVSGEEGSEMERNLGPARANKAKSARDVPAATPSASVGMQACKKATRQQAMPRHGATSSSNSVRVDFVPDPEDEWQETVAGDIKMPGALESVGLEEAEEEGDASAWFNPENMNYWASFMAGQPETEVQAPAVLQATEQTGKHVRWTPTVGGESDDEEGFGGGDEELATSMWMQYAISGGDIPGLGGTTEEPQAAPSESALRDTSAWAQGRGKKLNPTAGDVGNRAQQTSVFDRAALTGQWPKMESWLSPPSRGQYSGSARVF